jgi:hypothetical protein
MRAIVDWIPLPRPLALIVVISALVALVFRSSRSAAAGAPRRWPAAPS